MTTSPLIGVEELRSLLGTPAAPVVLDVRYRMGGPGGPEEHEAGHVPGAAYVDMNADLAAPPGEGGRHPLPDPAVFVAAMQRAGVGIETPVVVYDDWAGHAAARAWWLLRHYGHRDVRLLDGGWSAWQAAGGDVETGPVPTATGDFHGVPGTMPVVDADGAARIAAAGTLIDARAPERFRGEIEPVDPVAGHIPGAVNHPTSWNLDNHGHFQDVRALRESYRHVGTGVGKDVAVYCGSGVTACHDIVALELLGIPAALYPGSWSGWIAAGRAR
ncbi:sulfurtransferase [Nocardioides jiangxiensis]|uniref:Sulfurtransferase n=1 Tax=Nocardioides jiangxiensis TaxID=3064524 RepID=A0ABT9B3P7_9ACTN|nr:sulfurtransferase [Nocardioides sp. WY-20]MDO7869466.1 sulfurtransferase [Nocardioides sp. WY-20]